MADWTSVFDNFGIKTVTKTDKGKGAYVPTAAQRAAIAAAGIKPAVVRPAPGFPVTVLFDGKVSSVESSYYHAERSDEAERSPEPRMGHEIISSWLNVGDTLLIGNIGPQLFAAKVDAVSAPADKVADELAKKADKATILDRASKAKGKPPKQVVQRQDFARKPVVVAGALVRAGGKCEMPGCTTPLFHKDDGSPYLEVHHVDPLGEGGADELANAAALCPRCHREMHFGKDRMARRAVLKAYVSGLSTTKLAA